MSKKTFFKFVFEIYFEVPPHNTVPVLRSNHSPALKNRYSGNLRELLTKYLRRNIYFSKVFDFLLAENIFQKTFVVLSRFVFYF